MNLIIEKLSQKHLPLIDAFSCVETSETLTSFNSKERKRIIKHSKEMEDFLKTEALEEQENYLNTTHLIIDEDNQKLVAYLSLCTDSLRLELTEKNEMGFTYHNIPAIKIARLAVSIDYRGLKIGKMLIDLSAHIGRKMTEYCGVAFLTLDCYKHRLSYYEQYGFVKNLHQPIQLPYDSPISMRVSLNEYLSKIGSEQS